MPASWPSIQARTVLITSVSGWFSVKTSSQRGIVSVGTKALLAKVSGKTKTKIAPVAASKVS